MYVARGGQLTRVHLAFPLEPLRRLTPGVGLRVLLEATIDCCNDAVDTLLREA